jgi:glycine betaine/proline transport system ATP-binding protein
MAAYLELKNLTKIFGPQPQQALNALDDGAGKSELLDKTGHVLGVHNVSLDVAQGELFVIMGLSGSGKSTLVRLINRLIEPTAGTVCLVDVDITAMNRHQLVDLRRTKMSMVFQSFALLPHRSVLDNVALGLEIAGVRRKEAHIRSRDALELVGIPEVADHRPDQLSGGMQQRVGLARAWVTQPAIMLMDEAFSALDPLIRTEMQDALLALQKEERRTIVFISHDLAEASRIADRIAVMAEGEIRQIGTPAEIIANPADEYVKAFFRDVQMGRLLTAGDIAEPGDVDPHAEPVSAADVLEAVIPKLAATERPVPVKDASGNIIGRIDRTGLLQALSRGHDS